MAAVKWYQTAAEQGNPYAQYNLGHSYYYGAGVAKDYVRALKWYTLSASSLPASDKNAKTLVEAERNRVVKLMSRGKIAEAQKLAREWKPTK